ncbi:MAG: elongation factor G [bacterium]|nr:elongation factor G [bacterium]
MEKPEIEKVRNVAILAHGGAGKSTLIEAMLVDCHEIRSMGSHASGGLVMMTEPEEEQRHIAITPHIGHLSHNDFSVNLVDTPGYYSFLESTRGVLPGVDGAVLIFSAVDGARPECRRLWKMLEQEFVPCLGFVNYIDHENADFARAVTQIEKRLGVMVLPLAVPYHSDGVLGIVDLVTQKLLVSMEGGDTAERLLDEREKAEVEAFKLRLVEKIAESDDELLAKYLDGAELSLGEIEKGVKKAIREKAFLPVVCGSATRNIGVTSLLDRMTEYLPSPLERDEHRPAFDVNNPGEVRLCDRSAPFSAISLKTMVDPFSGKLSVIRVFSGEVKSGQGVTNSTSGMKQRVGAVFHLQGKSLVKVDALCAGDIGALSKCDETHTGDTLCDPSSVITFPHVVFVQPPVSYAVDADGSSEEKLSEGLLKLVDEDPTLHVWHDEQTHETILAGMGQTHIEVALQRLVRKFGAKAHLRSPRVPYRETIKNSVSVQGKLKKQSGGHGQFANCFIEVEPGERGSGLVFEDHIKGGVIPKQFIPSIQRGVCAAMAKGPLAGYPVVDLVVRLVDGSYHAVDSSDQAFQVAGSLALKAALDEGGSQLLEPLMEIEVVVPEELTGEVVKDLSSRRGRIGGMTIDDGEQSIEAIVPMSEVLDYGNVLNALTSGRGSYQMSSADYAEVPEHIAKSVIAG